LFGLDQSGPHASLVVQFSKNKSCHFPSPRLAATFTIYHIRLVQCKHFFLPIHLNYAFLKRRKLMYHITSHKVKFSSQ
jgi:hypothetical protein